MPDRDVVERVLAHDPLRHALDDGLDREVRLRELGDGLAPPHDAVVGRDLHQAEVPERVVVVRLRVAHGDRFDRLDLAHEGRAPFGRWQGDRPLRPAFVG
jgi:hypothetical protein